MNKEDCLMLSPIFKVLEKPEIELITKNILEINYKEGEIIFKQGTALTNIIILGSGLAKIYIEGKNNRNLTLQYMKPPEFIGGPGAFVDNRHHYSVSVLIDSCAYMIDIHLFKQIMSHNNNFAMEYIKDISRKGIYNFDKFISLTQKNMHGRIADGLIYLNKVYEDFQEYFPFLRQDLADLTGMNKDSAGRIIKEFENSGVIRINGNKIEIVDHEILDQISEFG